MVGWKYYKAALYFTNTSIRFNRLGAKMHTNLHVVTGLFDGMNVATNKIILGFHLVSILPSSRYDVIRHEGFTTTFYSHRAKQKISFRLNFLIPSWYDVTVHKGLTKHMRHIILKPYLRFAHHTWHVIHRLDSTGFHSVKSYLLHQITSTPGT